jgi:hypothetical protein
MTTLTRTLAALVTFALLVAACSNDDGDTTSAEDGSADSSTTTSEAGTEDADGDPGTDSDADGSADGDDDVDADDKAGDADGAAADDADGDAEEEGGDAGASGAADESSDGDNDGSAADDEGGEPGAGDGDDAAVAPDAGITILGVSFASGTVTIRNDSAAAVDFTGYFTCNRPQYAEMPAETLQPGATLDLDVTDLDVRASAGEFALYSSRSFDDPADMVAYVQWGKPDNGRSATAVEAGLIDDGEFIDNGGDDLVLE